MNTTEIAQDMVELNKQGRFVEAGEKYWAEDVLSVEAGGDNPVSRGKEAAHAKGEWWANAFEVNNLVIEGPYVNGDQFAVRFKLDTTEKASGQRSTMDEVGIYTVKDGKIAEERFFNGG
ncbi:MAG: nuclear transport factor 2 family protein [Phenylobacterium sp.]